MTHGVYGGLGLAAIRVALGPDTLVTTASDHVALRTPTRPEFPDGNALHLLRPPIDLASWIERFDRTVGVVGATCRQVRWEVDSRAEGVDSRAEGVGAELPAGVAWHRNDVVEFDAVADVASGADDVALVSASDDRHWAGAKVLYLHTGWVGDERYWRWLVTQQRAVAEAGRGAVFLAYRVGVPAARVGVFHDRGGLAVVTDLVVHPLHRGQGLGTAVVGAAVARHLANHPTDRVVAVVPEGSTLWARAGFVARGSVVTVGS